MANAKSAHKFRICVSTRSARKQNEAFRTRIFGHRCRVELGLYLFSHKNIFRVIKLYKIAPSFVLVFFRMQKLTLPDIASTDAAARCS